MRQPYPELSFGTPRKLPRVDELKGRVAVLDIAFAAEGPGVSFEKTTKKFIDRLGTRLAVWVDHHDHQKHDEYRSDPRFVLHTKQEHGACPEIITPEMVERIGIVDTVCCHVDFDGLCSAAKWIRGGIEPYVGADADAHAIDTRLGKPSRIGLTLDRALRARPRDDSLKGLMVRFLVEGATDVGIFREMQEIAAAMEAMDREAERLAAEYEVDENVAAVDGRKAKSAYDKTTLLLLGQERALISVVYDDSTVTIAARFDSGVDLLSLLKIEGGMPTRVSVDGKDLQKVLPVLRDYAKGR